MNGAEHLREHAYKYAEEFKQSETNQVRRIRVANVDVHRRAGMTGVN
jgi:hypothetical protein